MPYFRERPLGLLSLPGLVLLSACGAKPECDSFETRNAVLQFISDNHNNPLVAYAAKNSTANKDGSNNSSPDAAKSANSENEKPLYRLGERIVTTSTSDDKRTLKCSGAISATVGDTKASKEVDLPCNNCLMARCPFRSSHSSSRFSSARAVASDVSTCKLLLRLRRGTERRNDYSILAL